MKSDRFKRTFSAQFPLALLVILFSVVCFSIVVPLQAAEVAESSSTSVHPHDLAQSQSDSVSQPTTISAQHEKDPVEEGESPGVFDFLTSSKYLAWIGMMAVGIVLLLLKGINRWVRLGMLLVAFVLFGLDYIFMVHPSPMCGVTKLFTFGITQGTLIPIFLAIFLAIFIPSLIGRKLFCGWVCPLGALQELINKIPFRPRWKQFDFRAFNAIRFALLAMFFLTFFDIKSYLAYFAQDIGNVPPDLLTAYSAYSVYDPINYFEMLHWGGSDPRWWVMMLILVAVSLVLYRPFCYTICPIGAISWLLEKVAPGRIRIDRKLCNDCGVCVIKSPCPTIKPLLEGKNLTLPDCTSCGECISTCSRKAIKFGFTR
jgi:ferredoxin-type protein NapH